MKSVFVVAGILLACAPAAFGQEASVGSLRLLTPGAQTAPEAPAMASSIAPPSTTPAAPVAEAPAPVAASLETPIAARVIPSSVPTAPPSRAASGWTGPVNFAPIAMADMIGRVCRPSATGDGGELSGLAASLGLGASQPAADNLARALPGGAVTWQVPTADGVLFLMGYGEEPMNCGVAVVRPMQDIAFNRVLEILKAPAMGFVEDSTQTLPGNVHWMRLKSPKGEFVDLMEYPPLGDEPGVLRADFLPE